MIQNGNQIAAHSGFFFRRQLEIRQLCHPSHIVNRYTCLLTHYQSSLFGLPHSGSFGLSLQSVSRRPLLPLSAPPRQQAVSAYSSTDATRLRQQPLYEPLPRQNPPRFPAPPAPCRRPRATPRRVYLHPALLSGFVVTTL